MKEIFKDIKNYEGLYQVSNLGRVYSIRNNKILKPKLNKCGYLSVNLKYKGSHVTKSIHRLVAEAFIPNPNDFPQVNHKDEDKTNNCVDNLEWCTAKYNINYGTCRERTAQHFRKPVLMFDLNNNFIKEFNSVAEASSYVNGDHSNIVCCCLMYEHYNSAYGYKWKYK